MSGPPRPLPDGRVRREITLRLPRFPGRLNALRRDIQGLRSDVQRMLGGDLDFDDWLTYGRSRGWITKPYCDMHEPTPLSAEEEDILNGAYEDDEGYDDPCIPVVRIWLDVANGYI